jgi:hypothetical protein
MSWVKFAAIVSVFFSIISVDFVKAQTAPTDEIVYQKIGPEGGAFVIKINESGSLGYVNKNVLRKRQQ